MKWLLVVLVGGVTPVQTDVVFEKLSDCLAAEQQLRNAYTEALETRERQMAMDVDRLDRHERRDFYRERRADRQVVNTGTCIPHSGTDQAITSLNKADQAPAQPVTPPAPSPSPSPRP